MTDPAYRTMGLTVPVTEVLDPRLWRERYAYGVVLGQGEPLEEASALDNIYGCKPGRKAKTAGGQANALQDIVSSRANEIPDHVIRWHLRTALSELEMKLGIPMGVVIVKGDPVDPGLVQGQDFDYAEPRRVFLRSEQREFYRIDLPAGVVSVERVRAFWFGQPVWSVSQADSNFGMLLLEHPGTSSLHVLPTQATTLLVAMPTLASAAYGALQMIQGFPGQLPGVWSVDYTLAPKARYGTTGQIEAVLAHWCYCIAGIMLLSLGGMGASRGVSSASLSLDGLSKSVGLQASAIYGINSALETRLKEASERIDWKRLRDYKRGLRVRGYGGG